MIPSYDTPLKRAKYRPDKTGPDKTFKIDWECNRLLSQTIEGEEALEQTVQIITAIEYQDWAIMPDWFGIEMKHMYGMPRPFVRANLERIIKEALAPEMRIKRIHDFWMEDLPNAIVAHFGIERKEGSFGASVKVEVKDVRG